MVSFSVTLCDPNPDFKVTILFKVNSKIVQDRAILI